MRCFQGVWDNSLACSDLLSPGNYNLVDNFTKGLKNPITSRLLFTASVLDFVSTRTHREPLQT